MRKAASAAGLAFVAGALSGLCIFGLGVLAVFLIVKAFVDVVLVLFAAMAHVAGSLKVLVPRVGVHG